MEAVEPLNLEDVLPLALIREHTKTDDVPSVSNAQLMLYRQAAFEAAEQYTGRVFTRSGYVVQSMAVPVNGLGGPRMSEMVAPYSPWGRPMPNARPRNIAVNLQAPTADGVILLTYKGSSQTLMVPPGSTRIMVPYFTETLDGCCDPCGMQGPAYNFGVTARYRIGVCQAADIPAGIKIGCLKLIAWHVGNPGDVLQVVNDGNRSSTSGLVGTNNATWASGAIEQWRQYLPSVSR